MTIRLVEQNDLAILSRIRGRDAASEQHWLGRISGYYQGTYGPQHALGPRAIFVATEAGQITGFIAGNLTTRYDCDGELQWLNTTPEYGRKGIAAALLQSLASWFVTHHAYRICVNCAPDNIAAMAFYKKNGAISLNEHWLLWTDIRDSKNLDQ